MNTFTTSTECNEINSSQNNTTPPLPKPIRVKHSLDPGMHTVVILDPSSSQRQVDDSRYNHPPLQSLTTSRRGHEDLLTRLLPNINQMEIENRNLGNNAVNTDDEDCGDKTMNGDDEARSQKEKIILMMQLKWRQ